MAATLLMVTSVVLIMILRVSWRWQFDSGTSQPGQVGVVRVRGLLVGGQATVASPLLHILNDRQCIAPWDQKGGGGGWSFRERSRTTCFSSSHSPAPQNFDPVLATSRCTGSAPAPDRGRCTSNPSARRLRVVCMVRHRKIEAQHADDRTDQLFRLAQREAKRQRRQNGQWGIPGSATPAGPRRGAPCGNCLFGEPHRQLPRWRRPAS
jgi:hypothetical protein